MKIICEINTFKSGLMALIFMLPTFNSNAATALADKPIFSGANVPGNVALALSVEYPTAITRSYKANTYSLGETFKGYFDSEKCYTYAKYAAADTLTSPHYFVPSSQAVGHDCKGVAWSGNFLNFATTQTIDPFRQALTGGFRRVDTVNTTVLEKAFASADDPGLAPITTIKESLVSKSTPYNWSSFSLRIYSLGHRMWYTNNGNLLATDTNADKPGDVSDRVVDPNDGTKVYEKYVRNQVCVSGLLESNCVAYGTNFKPEGLIQKNAMKLRFAAFGYLKEKGTARNGGVLRAKMASLGPNRPVPNAPDEPNIDGGSYKGEWDKDTGQFIKNPAPQDAIKTGITAPASGIGYSGVVNYLNNFGVDGGGYKFNDPVSELYYAVTRYYKYYKGQGNLADYTNNLNDSNKDGFPVITEWDEPIKYTCQANFILGVGDIRTHADSDLPGSTIGGNNNPVDATVNVLDATNRVGDMERAEDSGFLTSLGTRRPADLPVDPKKPTGPKNCCGGNSYFMAGLAYDIHTNDIRDTMAEKQTVSTYWLDVLEGGYIAKNQFWLAAKYGGFTDIPKDFKPYEGKAKALLPTQWEGKDDNGIPNGIPNNYFKADKPQTMIDGLGKAFNDILIKTNGSASAFAVISPDVANDDFSYATSYTVDGWFGDVIGSKIIVKDGIASASIPPKWKASDIGNLEGQDWDTGRFIASANCVADDTSAGTQKCTGAEFRLAKMSTENVNNLGTSNQQDMLNYLRGNRTNSIGVASNVYRPKILGDIVNSKIFPIGGPRANYSDEFNPGYSQFKKDYSGRLKVAYVGANDGMLHAFDGGVEGGKEIFAYVPQALFAGPTSTPVDDGLRALAKIPYVHRYYVDASPVVTDVNFGGGATDWHSLLVGGLGKGGKSYYAIDVTNPNSLSDEPNLAKAVKWEFKHKDMGYTYGRPLMVKVKTDKVGVTRWVVVLTSGYNNGDGKGHFFIVDPSNGKLIQDISTEEGSITNEAGLAQVTAFVADSRDFTADALYAGDLLGNLWRVDLTTGNPGKYAKPIKLATLTTSTGVVQPVTVPPVVEFDQNTLKRFVFVGTGRLLDNLDVNNTQEQTFYAINDGTQSKFFTSATAPVPFPFKRGEAMLNDDTANGLLTNLPDNKIGYYKDLGFGSNGVGYRVNVEMRGSAGIIAFIANLTAGNSCNPSGTSRTYALTYGTGKSVLSVGTELVPYAENSKGLGTSITVYNAAPYDGGIKLVTSDDKGGNSTSETNPPAIGGFKQLNWREVPTAN